MRHSLLPLLLLMSSPIFAQGDGTIFLTNPSFEDMPRAGAAPKGWTDCGFAGETAPDVQPDPKHEFKVYKQAQHQQTYLGMVARDNETHERVGQLMSVPMQGGQCYELRIQLARSESYRSRSKTSDVEMNYVTPLKLQVWGGYSVCDLRQKLGESPMVTNFNWQEYRVKLKPEQDYTHIVLEAYYKTPILFPYNGNLLLDNAAPIRPVDCDEDLWAPPTEEDEVIATTPPVNPDNEIKVTPVRPSTPTQRPAVARQPVPREPEAPTVKLGETEGELRTGQIFAIEDIRFKANSAELEQESEKALAEIAGFLKSNSNVIVEIGGHASYKAGPTYAARISEDRAKSVVDYLNALHVGGDRMFPRGYGKSRPVCMEDSADCNRRNQRVEVKILKIGTK